MSSLTFNSDPELKALFVKQANEHLDQDKLLKGTYAKLLYDDFTGKMKFKGCSVGCFARDVTNNITSRKTYVGSPHEIVSNFYHLPLWLIEFQDFIFEYLPKPEHINWHVEFSESILVGADNDDLYAKFTARLFDEFEFVFANQLIGISSITRFILKGDVEDIYRNVRKLRAILLNVLRSEITNEA